MKIIRSFSILIKLTLLVCVISCNNSPKTYDIIVYGGTSAGIAAAIQASRMGKSAIIIEPSNHIGGLTTGGLGATDIGNKQVIGGISREFYERIAQKYDNPTA